MGSQWGLGMVANGGDCPDCDAGDVADRIAFITPLLGHLWAVAYDFTAVGVETEQKNGIVPSTSNRARRCIPYLRVPALERRAHARPADAPGKLTVNYGAYVSYRWQVNDVPADYLPLAAP